MWVTIAIALVGLLIALSTRVAVPKQPDAQKGEVPDVKDGKRVIRIYGTVWIDDPIQLAMKEVGETPIRKK